MLEKNEGGFGIGAKNSSIHILGYLQFKKSHKKWFTNVIYSAAACIEVMKMKYSTLNVKLVVTLLTLDMCIVVQRQDPVKPHGGSEPFLIL